MIGGREVNEQKIEKMFAMAVVAATVSGTALTAVAADRSDVFDADHYAETYDDVEAVYGHDADALYQHYLAHGIAEGRTAGTFFDVVKILISNGFPRK